ncbi:MAG: PKD domain-containing protein, partial [Solirubrobacteraceae bacterium]
MRVLRTIRTALLLAAALTLGPAAAAAYAGGPGVIFYPKGRQGVPLLGSQVTGVANIPQRTYTLPARAGRSQVTVSAISVRSLIMLSGVRPETVTFVQIVNGYGGSFVLRREGFASGLVSDDGSTTRYFRSSGGGAVRDYIEATDSSGPLEISVDGGADIPVRASASPRRAAVGQAVSFHARVRFSPPGSQFSYEWDFGDGRTLTGASVTHIYDSSGPFRAQVS